jgi:peptidoglycan/xylan/chitin deacetylase (PgdA/CDA1 family)
MAFSILISAAVLAAALYVVWRVRFGYPPADIPAVLCFHKVTRQFQWEGTWTTPSRFAATVDRLLESGYRFIGEEEYLRSLDRPGAAASRSVFLTFDDAYEDVYTEALPILAARAIPFHVFVVTGFVGRTNDWELGLGRPHRRHASWEQLRGMIDAGATVGSHTASHPDLTRVDPAVALAELTRSRRTIRERLGVAARTVSYPFGRCNARVMAAAGAAGFEAGFSLYPRHHNRRVERFALRRNGVYIIDPAAWVAVKLGRNPWFWFEEMKCRAINAVAVLTPVLKRSEPTPPAPDSEGRSEAGSRRATQ